MVGQSLGKRKRNGETEQEGIQIPLALAKW
jgi:hypothetical protein